MTSANCSTLDRRLGVRACAVSALVVAALTGTVVWLAALAWLCGYIAVLVRLNRGQLGRLEAPHAKLTWLLCLCTLFVVQAVLTRLAESSCVPCPDALLFNVGLAPLPLAAFAMLTLSELVTLGFKWAGGEVELFGYLRQPVLAVHTTSFVYYALAASRTLVCVPDRFGRSLSPLRYAFWTGSVSSMVLCIFYVVDQRLLCLVWQLGPRATEAVAALDTNVRRALAGVAAFNGLGLLAGLPWGPSLLGAIALLGSWASFYYVLYHVVEMLQRVEALSATLVGSRQARGVSVQYRIIRVVVVATWHLFGVIWAVAAAGLVSTEAEQAGYIIADLLAKYILMFVYVAQGGVANTKGD